MRNILISKTDPYSFMGLIKATRKESQMGPSFASLINAGIVSLFLIFAITRMAQAAQVEVHMNPVAELAINSTAATTCSLEACKMV